MSEVVNTNRPEQYGDTLLSSLTPPIPERGLVVLTAWNKDEILQTRPDVAQKYQSLTRQQKECYFVIRYKTEELSYDKFSEVTLKAEQVKLDELIRRQFARTFLSKGHKVIPEVKLGNYSLTAIKPHFSAEEAEIDTRVSYDYKRKKGENSPDRWVNTLLALKLTDPSSQNPEISGLADLKRFATKDNLKLDLKALFFGFVNLTDEKVFKDLLKNGIVNENNFQNYFLRISSWLSEIAVERSVSNQPRSQRTITHPYPLGSITPLGGSFPSEETEVQWPSAYYLPDMVASFVRYVDSVPKNVREGTQFPISELVSSRGKIYQYTRDVLMHHMLARDALSKSDFETITNDCAKFDPRVNFYEQITKLFNEPILLALKSIKESGSVSDQTKNEVTDEVRQIAELCLNLNSEYEDALNSLAQNPGLWNRTQPKYDKGDPLTFSEIRSNIITQGGRPNSSLFAAIHNFRMKLQSGQDD